MAVKSKNCNHRCKKTTQKKDEENERAETKTDCEPVTTFAWRSVIKKQQREK